MNRIKLMQLVKEVLSEMNDQVIDVNATLRVIQAAVKSGSEVTVDGKPLFKMPFINRATIVGGGIQDFPRDESLEDMNILIDGEPLQLIYKDAPQPVKPIERTPEEIEDWKLHAESPTCELDRIARKYNCDKANMQIMSHSWKNVPSDWPPDLNLKIVGHNYTEEYEKVFSALRDKPIKILEIGMGNYPTNAKSLMAWLEYFEKAEIHVIDNNVNNFSRIPYEIDESRVKFYVLDQSSPENLDEFVSLIGSETFDIIIDDGSHVADHQLLTLEKLFDSVLKFGGHYFIEDIHDRSFCDGVANLVRSVNVGNVSGQFQSEKRSMKTLSSVKFLRSLVVLEKSKKTTR